MTGNVARTCQTTFAISSVILNSLFLLWSKKAVKLDFCSLQVTISVQRRHGKTNISCVFILYSLVLNKCLNPEPSAQDPLRHSIGSLKTLCKSLDLFLSVLTVMSCHGQVIHWQDFWHPML